MDLVKPSNIYEASYKEYISELGNEERYPFPLDFDHSNFSRLLARLDDFAKGENLSEGYVQSSTLWLVKNGEILGVTNIRHCLNEAIEHCGGHIGLGIRPSQRGKGLGIELMRRSIEFLKTSGVNQVHIHCYKDNVASAKSIQACGGNLDSEITDSGKVVQRFIVDNR